jgi:hexosaminidase
VPPPRPTFELLIALTSASVAPALASPSPALVPSPQQVGTHSGVAQLTPVWRVCSVGDSATGVGINGLLADVQRAWGWSWNLASGVSRQTIVVRPRGPFAEGNPLQESQGYELRVDRDSIVVAAPTPVGRRYGIQTLRQLIRNSPAGRIPRLLIKDFPALPWRGVSDDISRGQASTLADFKATLEHLAFYKINMYFLYIEDMARFWSAPEVGVERAALTPSELRMIVEEGKRHDVTVVPIFQTLGHQERLLGYPAFRRYAERQRPTGFAAWLERITWNFLPAVARAWGIQDPAEVGPAPTCFSAVLPETRQRVGELVDEIAVAMPSPFLHLGGDEPSDLGTGTSRKAVAKRGFGAVYADYMKSLTTRVENVHRRQPMIFSDVLLKDSLALSAIPKNVAIIDWHYDGDDSGATLQRLHRAGYRTLFASPGLWNWFAIYPDYGRAFPNIANQASAARVNGASGLVVASWGDGGAESLRRSNWAGYAYAADAAWSSSADSEEFLDRFVATEYGISDVGLARAERLVGWQPFPTLGFNQRLFHWKPRLRTHDSVWLDRMQSLFRDMLEARRLIGHAAKNVRFNRERIDVLDHAAARFQYAADRELTMEAVAARLGQGWMSLSVAERQSSLSSIAGLRDSSVALESRYAELWRRDNRRPMLDPLLLRLRQQTSALESMMAQARAGTLRPERRISSAPIPKERGAHDAGK